MPFPFKSGFTQDSSTVSSEKVTDNSSTERKVFDSDGYLYQRNTKITATGAEINTLAGVTAGTVSASGAVVVDSNSKVKGLILDGNLQGTPVTSHSYGGAHADWTLSATEKLSFQLICTNADAGANIIAPSENRMYWIYNNSGQTITIKKSAGTGVSIATGKYAGVYYNGSDYAKFTPDL